MKFLALAIIAIVTFFVTLFGLLFLFAGAVTS